MLNLLQSGANPDYQDLDGVSPLHCESQVAIFHPLLYRKACFETYLAGAALQGHSGIIQILLQHNAYPNFMEVNGNKSTPLDYAYVGGYFYYHFTVFDLSLLRKPRRLRPASH